MPKLLKLLSLIISLSFGYLLFFFYPTDVLAAPSCQSRGVTITPNKLQYSINEPISMEVKIGKPYSSEINPDWFFDVAFLQDGIWNVAPWSTNDFKDTRVNTTTDIQVPLTGAGMGVGTYTLGLRSVGINNLTTNEVREGPKIKIAPALLNQVQCSADIPNNVQFRTNTTIPVSVNPKTPHVNYLFLVIRGKKSPDDFKLSSQSLSPQALGAIHTEAIGVATTTVLVPNSLEMGDYTGVILAQSEGQQWGCEIKSFKISRDPTSSVSNPSQAAPDTGKENQAKLQNQGIKASTAAGERCDPKTGKSQADGLGILTSIGCIPVDPTAFIQAFLGLAMAVGGGIALLLMSAGAFQMMTSMGNPDNLKKGQEQFTSAIMGLLFIIFSILLLEIIGVDILGLPGFTR